MLAAFQAGELNRDVVVVVRFQGPRANGMPELHKLTPMLGVLQDKGFKVALVTDGRMSGASGKVPAAIHCSPEALNDGPLARLRDGDVIRLCGHDGRLEAVDVDLASREPPSRRRRRSAPAVSCSPSCAPPPTMPNMAVRRCCRRWRRWRDDRRSHERRAGHPGAASLEGSSTRSSLAETLVEAGLPVIEVTLRTPDMRSTRIRAMATVKGAIVGAGTVLTRQQLDQAIDAGANFIVSPGLTHPWRCGDDNAAFPSCRASRPRATSCAASTSGSTGSNSSRPRRRAGLRTEGSCRAVRAVRFCPTGGITRQIRRQWLEHPSVLCVGGSWIVPAGDSDLAAVAERARAAAGLRQ